MANAFPRVSHLPALIAMAKAEEEPRAFLWACWEPRHHIKSVTEPIRENYFPLFNVHIHVPWIFLYVTGRTLRAGFRTCRCRKPISIACLGRGRSLIRRRIWIVRSSRTRLADAGSSPRNLRLGRCNKPHRSDLSNILSAICRIKLGLQNPFQNADPNTNQMSETKDQRYHTVQNSHYLYFQKEKN